MGGLALRCAEGGIHLPRPLAFDTVAAPGCCDFFTARWRDLCENTRSKQFSQ